MDVVGDGMRDVVFGGGIIVNGLAIGIDVLGLCEVVVVGVDVHIIVAIIVNAERGRDGGRGSGGHLGG